MKKTLFIIVSILALSCSSSDDSPNQTSMNLVTGVTFRQTSDDTPLQLGNPNTLVSGRFVMYPNPAKNSIVIAADQNVTDLWIVKADARKVHQNVDFSTVLNSNLYSQESIGSLSEISLGGRSENTIMTGISGLEKGYYRVFVKIGGQIYWDNLYKSDDSDDEQQINAIIDFWN